MWNKAAYYSAVAKDTLTGLTSSWQEWVKFLNTASRVYKYPFMDQLMIYAQRPDATACAEYRVWKNQLNRYVRYGSTGIALLDESGNKPRLRYVFDISDTGTRKNSRDPWLWKLDDRFITHVSAMLEQNFKAADNTLEEQILTTAKGLAAYSARTAHPFQRNGAPFRFKLSKAQQVD